MPGPQVQGAADLHHHDEKCTGCTACAKGCPVKAISGERKKLHVIDQAQCIKCGECVRRCNFEAVLVD